MPRRKVLTIEECIAKLKEVLLEQIRKCMGVRHKVAAPAVGAVRPLLPLARQMRGGRFRSDHEVLGVFCTEEALEELFRYCRNDYWFAMVLHEAVHVGNELPVSSAAVQQAVSVHSQCLGQLPGQRVAGVKSPELLTAALAAHLVDHGAILLDGNVHCPRLVWNPLFRC